jgi:hypothetical protein
MGNILGGTPNKKNRKVDTTASWIKLPTSHMSEQYEIFGLGIFAIIATIIWSACDSYHLYK